MNKITNTAKNLGNSSRKFAKWVMGYNTNNNVDAVSGAAPKGDKNNHTMDITQNYDKSQLGLEATTDIVNAMLDSFNTFASTNAQAAMQANAIQWAMFNKQMQFNSEEAATNRAFQADQANIANAFTSSMWDRTAGFNVANSQEAREWSAQQAQIQRDWQEHMDNTQVQRRMADLKAAGINPILAGGLQASTPSGAMGTTSTPNMSSANGAMASGSGASAGLPSAYMENTSNELALFGAAINAIGVGIDKLSKAGSLKSGMNLVKQFLKH